MTKTQKSQLRSGPPAEVVAEFIHRLDVDEAEYTKALGVQQLRSRFAFIAEQAAQAQRMRPSDDNLLDVVDGIDKELQSAIEIINRLRGTEAS